MHTIINPKNSDRRFRRAAPDEAQFLKPVYDCEAQGDAIKLVVYLPGVDASGVSIEATGSITACACGWAAPLPTRRCMPICARECLSCACRAARKVLRGRRCDSAALHEGARAR